jgi:hypothetical protein
MKPPLPTDLFNLRSYIKNDDGQYLSNARRV